MDTESQLIFEQYITENMLRNILASSLCVIGVGCMTSGPDISPSTLPQKSGQLNDRMKESLFGQGLQDPYISGPLTSHPELRRLLLQHLYADIGDPNGIFQKKFSSVAQSRKYTKEEFVLLVYNWESDPDYGWSGWDAWLKDWIDRNVT
jgi:hypothetical protein